MKNEFTPLEKTLMAMSLGLSPRQRKTMATKAAQTLRKANSDRIKANIAPDGEALVPRKPPKKGKIRRKAKMFRKLREFRHLKYRSSDDGFEVGFTPGASNIALIHHEGRTSYINRKKSNRRIKYPERPLLGISDADEAMIADKIVTLFDNV